MIITAPNLEKAIKAFEISCQINSVSERRRIRLEERGAARIVTERPD
jgi:hypothetical protein